MREIHAHVGKIIAASITVTKGLKSANTMTTVVGEPSDFAQAQPDQIESGFVSIVEKEVLDVFDAAN